MDNVKLWFAKDEKENILTINDITEINKNNTYSCPMCASKLIPKAIKSKQVTSHFAHVDVSKCGESMVHWWFKHKFLEKGDSFVVKSDVEKQYICKDVLVEQEYEVGEKVYKPDVTIITECGNVIYFEMAFSNKKKIKDYLDIWLELKNIAVEVDIKDLMNKGEIPTFKALFFEGKCFNTKRNDTYYNTIGKYKEEKLRGEDSKGLKERIQKLDWFWDDVLRYKNGHADIEHMINVIDNINKSDLFLVEKILKKVRCNDIYDKYKKYLSLDYPFHFNNALNKDSIIREAIIELNKNYRKIKNKGFKVKLERDSHHYKDTVWFRGRKKGVYKLSHYTYSILLLYEADGSHNVMKAVNITNRIMNMKNVDMIFSYVDDIFCKLIN